MLISGDPMADNPAFQVYEMPHGRDSYGSSRWTPRPGSPAYPLLQVMMQRDVHELGNLFHARIKARIKLETKFQRDWSILR